MYYQAFELDNTCLIIFSLSFTSLSLSLTKDQVNMSSSLSNFRLTLGRFKVLHVFSSCVVRLFHLLGKSGFIYNLVKS